jgi:RNA polymerase sigma-70 factor (ECF subfamily)
MLMRESEFDTAEFLVRLRQGDELAYSTLFKRLRSSLITIAVSIVGSRAQAEEVVQDAWIAVFSSIKSFEGRASLVTWIVSIVLNRARTHATRERRRPGSLEVTARADRPDDDNLTETLSGRNEISPERIVIGRQMWAKLRQAVDALSPIQRALISLRVEGYDATDTSKLLAISLANQRVLLHRARRRLRQRVGLEVERHPFGPRP